jgi:hypothetical protein
MGGKTKKLSNKHLKNNKKIYLAGYSDVMLFLVFILKTGYFLCKTASG